jgi:predicted heme/steroid binding protein/uncharacterized membrane protein
LLDNNVYVAIIHEANASQDVLGLCHERAGGAKTIVMLPGEAMKVFKPEDMGSYSGSEGAPAYVAYEGKVYDVSGSRLWKTGTHMMRHKAGQVMDGQMAAAPHGPEILERVPLVGTLVPAAQPERDEESSLSQFLDRYPFLKRHPHPMLVHFPIAFIIGSLLLEAVYLLTGFASFRTSSVHCLGLGFLFLPFAVGTGYLTWIINYMGKPMRSVNIKIRLSWPLFILAMIVLVWQINSAAGRGPAYFLALLVLCSLVSVIGYYGGGLTIK